MKEFIIKIYLNSGKIKYVVEGGGQFYFIDSPSDATSYISGEIYDAENRLRSFCDEHLGYIKKIERKIKK